MLKFGIIGYGYWGKNLARNLFQLPYANLDSICDQSKINLLQASQDYSDVNLHVDHQELLNNKNIDAIIIATPVNTHYDLAVAAITAGKHLLIEKPLVTHLEQAKKLQALAKEHNVFMMVDYTPTHSSAAKTIRHMIQNQELGDVLYYDSVRAHFGSNDLNSSVIWDLAVHDLALVNYLLGENPNLISAAGTDFLHHHHAATASINLFFPGGKMAHLYVSWLEPEKIRRITVSGSKKTIIFDDCSIDKKITVYNKNISYIQQATDPALHFHKEGKQTIPVEHNDAITNMLIHFIECIEKQKLPETDITASIKFIQLLKSIEKSIALCGQPVEID